MSDELFKVHRLNDQGMAEAKVLEEAFASFLGDLEDICGESGREMAIVRTKLQEASFFAKRAMAMNPENNESVQP